MLVCVDTVGDGTSLQIKLQTDLFITICVKAECVSAIAGAATIRLFTKRIIVNSTMLAEYMYRMRNLTTYPRSFYTTNGCEHGQKRHGLNFISLRRHAKHVSNMMDIDNSLACNLVCVIMSGIY
jgi:hypothetical protein